MSVKFEQKETIRTNVGQSGVREALQKGDKSALLHEIGEKVTKGGSPDGYLAVRTYPYARSEQHNTY
jgi:hypothetical protein